MSEARGQGQETLEGLLASMKLEAISMERYNGGIAAKRRYGSATLTDFLVVDRDNPATRIDVKGVGGATPGERKARALQIAAEKLQGAQISGGCVCRCER
jgi:hypothetical protein